MVDNYLKILSFLKKYGGNQYKSLINALQMKSGTIWFLEVRLENLQERNLQS